MCERQVSHCEKVDEEGGRIDVPIVIYAPVRRDVNVKSDCAGRSSLAREGTDKVKHYGYNEIVI